MITKGGCKGITSSNLSGKLPEGKEAVMSQKIKPKLPTSVGGPPIELWVGRGSPQGWGPWKAPLDLNPLEVNY